MQRHMYKAIIIITALLCFGCSSSTRHEPLAESAFFFNKEGISQEFIIKPKFYSYTEIALLSSGNALPLYTADKRGFNWEITATAYRDNKPIESINLHPEAWWFADVLPAYKSVSLGSFRSLGIFPRETKIIITVKKTDPNFSVSDPSLKVVIRASTAP